MFGPVRGGPVCFDPSVGLVQEDIMVDFYIRPDRTETENRKMLGPRPDRWFFDSVGLEWVIEKNERP